MESGIHQKWFVVVRTVGFGATSGDGDASDAVEEGFRNFANFSD